MTTVNTKGQVTIPKQLRGRYGFPPGTRVIWLERDGHIVPEPVKRVEELRGSLGPGEGEEPLTRTLLAERAVDRAREDG